MSGRPARIRERELNKAMNVARKAGAKELRVHLGDDVSIVIPLVADDDKPIESERQITLWVWGQTMRCLGGAYGADTQHLR